MTSSRTWTVGAGPQCDIVVDQPAVSRRHCRLKQVSRDQFTIEDLETKNGTFVNGARTQGIQAVSPSDDVTLGQKVRLPWPCISDSEPPRQPKTIRIGRAADNDVVLDSATVSSHHARLLLDGDHLTIEDLESTNGTYVGSPDNRITSTKIDRTDTVYFGSMPCLVNQLLSKSSRVALRPRQGRGKLLVTIGAGVALLLPAILTTIFLRPPMRRSENVDRPRIAQKLQNFSKKPLRDSEPEKDRREPVSTDAEPTSTPPKQPRIGSDRERDLPEPNAAAALQNQPLHALFWILVGRHEGDEAYRVGTAWAFDGHTLATTASVVTAMQTLINDGFPKAQAVCPISHGYVRIAGAYVHPEYERAATTCRELQARYESTYRRLQSDGRTTEEIATHPTISDLRNEGFKTLDRQMYFDIGIIKLAQPVDCHLQVAEQAYLRPRMELRVLNLVIDGEDPFFEPAAKTSSLKLTERVRLIEQCSDDANGPRRLVVDCNQDQSKWILAGSPLVNDRGEVVAMYSRPATPPQPDHPSPSDTFEAVLVELIGDFVTPEDQ